MASSRYTTAVALFLALNLLFFTFTAANYCPPKHKRKTHKRPGIPKRPSPMPYYPPKRPSPMPYYPPPYGKCPIDALKLGVCANVLNGLLSAVVGQPPREPCCSLLKGLVDLEVAACLCTAIKANVLGVHLNVPVSLSLLVNYCGCKIPKGFQCP